MNLKELVTGKPGDKQFLLGNEAAVRGVIEAGVSVAATYPGTPSSEIGNVLSGLAKEANIYFEFSTNEKVAMEVAATAAASGLRSFTFMKHVGMNVASDSFMTTAYSGVNGGMVILSADDPSLFSSQNEQDTRNYGRLANVPILEPSNCQEVKDMVKYAFDLSEQFKLPVIVRTTTRVSHMRGVVEFGEVVDNSSEGESHWKKGFFKKNPAQFVPVPAFAKDMHVALVEKMDEINKITNESDFNVESYFSQNKKYGVIASSSAYNYAYDVIRYNNLDIDVLKLGFSYPFPYDKVADFVKDYDEVFIVEEVDPIIEKDTLVAIGKNSLNTVVHGKLDGTFPVYHEFNSDIVANGFNKYLNFIEENTDDYSDNLLNLQEEIPSRAPVLCAGCPHRAMYYGVNKALEELGIPLKDAVFASDIGCYTLGINPPYNAADYLLSMGSSVGDGCGFSIATNQKVISFIGDSTFFHSGISPLINAVHNKNNFILTVLDNRITAMTGGQPNPGIPVDGMGDDAPEISIRKLALACGCNYVRVINPLNLDQVVKTYKEALERDEVCVIIAKAPCTLIKGKTRKPPVNYIDSNCNGCNKCVSELACPAISKDGGKIAIDQSMCDGCGVCIQVCKYGALEAGRGE
ncbi:MAG: indolepyruvate ferredoxin oxidoreductase subunit alpha [Methanobrevibacter smithii]|nr:indolepyruvate ferredoxin oxidoreductase subunit alpha [Methanobrevibacter smithii]MCI7354526.1 indolepyruvate ferredoxin oxidoreductase subunit alpha [Methanobrevibacter smithii]MDD7243971.1 indolepyruvate ferredoxin oxidoreductase subunit alpha [Methanobrevibacter smithii]MDY5218426.1 indolepyruvate ferredoxin oxidoreductase subunit alpha [Methanobrevibacter smithii]HJI98534.1 indolepyruvate ferredoxin oxidoreductase subunit alpha [Methanobrevibacter smithii]